MNIIRPPFGTPLNPAHPLSKGLVLAMPFNDPPGDRVWDYSGQGNHGAIMGVTAQSATSGWGSGPHGGALGFDGGNDYIDCGNNASLNMTNALTITTWIYTAVNVPNNMRARIVSKYITGLAGYVLDIADDSGIEGFRFLCDGGVAKSADTVLRDQWVFLVGTYDRQNVQLYINGQLNKTTPGTAATISVVASNLQIGRDAANIAYLNGLISYISVYNRALSAIEIAYLYHNPYCIFQTPGFPAWLVPGVSADNYYRRLLAGGAG